MFMPYARVRRQLDASLCLSTSVADFSIAVNVAKRMKHLSLFVRALYLHGCGNSRDIQDGGTHGRGVTLDRSCVGVRYRELSDGLWLRHYRTASGTVPLHMRRSANFNTSRPEGMNA